MVAAVLVNLGGGQVQGQGHVLARHVAGLFDRRQEQLQGLLVRDHRRGKAALVAHGGVPAPVLDDGLEVVEDLGGPADRFDNGGGPERHDHVLLEIGRTAGVPAAVDEIDQRHGHREGAFRRAAGELGDVLVDRELLGAGAGPQAGDRDGQHGVGPEIGLVVGAVEVDHDLVEGPLVGYVLADEGGRDDGVDVLHRVQDAPAEVTLRVVVAEFQSFELAGGGARKAPCRKSSCGCPGRPSPPRWDCRGSPTIPGRIPAGSSSTHLSLPVAVDHGRFLHDSNCDRRRNREKVVDRLRIRNHKGHLGDAARESAGTIGAKKAALDGLGHPTPMSKIVLSVFVVDHDADINTLTH